MKTPSFILRLLLGFSFSLFSASSLAVVAQTAAPAATEIETNITAGKFDEAFAIGEKALATTPDDIVVLSLLTNASAEAVKKQNGKFVAQGIQYGTKVIGLIEAKKGQGALAVLAGPTSHVKRLPQLYQDVALLYLVSKELAKAKSFYEKASTLAPDDPMNFAMIASVLDEEYVAAAKAYQAESGGQKDALLKKANEQLDLVIEAYAKAIAVASAKPEYQPLATQARQNLEPYYKYRNKNSTEGMQALIDKYKPAMKTP